MNFTTLVEAITGSVVHTGAPRPTLGTQGPGLELTIHHVRALQICLTAGTNRNKGYYLAPVY